MAPSNGVTQIQEIAICNWLFKTVFLLSFSLGLLRTRVSLGLLENVLTCTSMRMCQSVECVFLFLFCVKTAGSLNKCSTSTHTQTRMIVFLSSRRVERILVKCCVRPEIKCVRLQMICLKRQFSTSTFGLDNAYTFVSEKWGWRQLLLVTKNCTEMFQSS